MKVGDSEWRNLVACAEETVEGLEMLLRGVSMGIRPPGIVDLIETMARDVEVMAAAYNVDDIEGQIATETGMPRTHPEVVAFSSICRRMFEATHQIRARLKHGTASA